MLLVLHDYSVISWEILPTWQPWFILSTYTRGSCQISRDRSRDFQSGASHQPNTSFDAEFHVGRRGIHFWTIFSSYIAKTTFWGSKKIQNSWICGGCVLTLAASRRLISPLKMMDLCSKTLFLVPETTINTFLVKYAIEWYHTSHILNHISLCLESDKCHVEFHVDLANLSHHFKVLIGAAQHIKFLRIWASSRGERASGSWTSLGAAVSRRALKPEPRMVSRFEPWICRFTIFVYR